MASDAARVLVVEDDPLIRASVAAALRSDGHLVREVEDGAGLPALALQFRPDLALVDVMLPGVDGITLARRLLRTGDIAVIFLTARDGVGDRLAGFGAGGDDYIVKPFITEELLARTRAVLRRRGRVADTIDLGALVVDEGAGVAVVGGAALDLTATEFRLLLFLARHRGRVWSKTQLLTQVWGYDDYDPNLVEVHVSALRRKIEQHGPRMLHTIRGLGYVLKAAEADAVDAA